MAYRKSFSDLKMGDEQQSTSAASGTSSNNQRQSFSSLSKPDPKTVAAYNAAVAAQERGYKRTVQESDAYNAAVAAQQNGYKRTMQEQARQNYEAAATAAEAAQRAGMKRTVQEYAAQNDAKQGTTGLFGALANLEQSYRSAGPSLDERHIERGWTQTSSTMPQAQITQARDIDNSILSAGKRFDASVIGGVSALFDAAKNLDISAGEDAKRVENARNNLAMYTQRRDTATNDADRAYWESMMEGAQRQINAYAGAIEQKHQPLTNTVNSLNEARDILNASASEGDYGVRAREALNKAELGTKSYTDDLSGLLGSNYSAGRLSQNSSYAWNEYINNPTPENRAIAALYDKSLDVMSANNADALAGANGAEDLLASWANYAPQFLDQSKARISGGIGGALVGQINAGQALGSAADMYALTRGAAFKGLIDAGIPEDRAIELAKDEAFISSIIEYLDSIGEYAFLGGKEIVGLLMGGGKDLAKTTAGKAAWEAAAKKLAAFGLNWIQEREEERSQEAVSIVNEQRGVTGDGTGKMDLVSRAWDKYVNEGLPGATKEVHNKLAPIYGGRQLALTADQERMNAAAKAGGDVALLYGGVQAGTGLTAELAGRRYGMQHAGNAFARAQQEYTETGAVSDKTAREIAINQPAVDILQRAGAVMLTDDMTLGQRTEAIKNGVGKLMEERGEFDEQTEAQTAQEPARQAKTPAEQETKIEDDLMQFPLRGLTDRLVQEDIKQGNHSASVFGRNGSRAFATAYTTEVAHRVNAKEAFEGFAKVYTAALKGESIPDVSVPKRLITAAKGAGQLDRKIAAQAKFFGAEAGLAKNRGGLPRNISARDARILDAFGKATGTKVLFTETFGRGDGYVTNASMSEDGGTMTLAKDALDPVRTSMAHEIIHDIRTKSPEAYQTLAQFVIDNMSDESFQSALRDRGINAYADMNYSLSDITEETVADAFGAMMDNPELLERVAKVDRTTAQKIYDAIQELIAKIKRAITGQKEAQLDPDQVQAFRDLQGKAGEMAKLLGDALAKTKATAAARAETQNATQEGGENKYSIKRTMQNKPFVEIDRDILAGVPESEWVETVRNNLNSKFPNGIVVGRNEIQIDRQSRREMTFSRYMQWLFNNDPQVREDKLRATDNADEILKAATNWIDEGLNHPRNDNIVDFARGDVLLKIGQNDYTAEVVVGTRKNGKMMMYDLLNLQPTSITEKETSAAIAENPSLGADRNTASLSDESIPQGSENSNSQNRESRRVNPTATLQESTVDTRFSRRTTKDAENVNVNYDAISESANAQRFSRRTWEASDYAKDKKKAAQDLSKALGCSVRTATKYINDVNSIAKIIADDRTRLDYEAAPGMSSFVSNAEYGGSIDFSTICKKRRLLTGTIEAIQKAMPDGVLTADELLKIRDMMKQRGYEVSCGLCYVEGSRAKMGEFAAEFIKLYKKYHPDAEWVPNMYDVSTPTGAEDMRLNHPDVYEEYSFFWNHYGTLRKGDPNLFASQQKPKLYQTATEYNGEILQKFKKGETVDAKNLNGGLRLQSFSDFEIIHLIDTMQVIMDMSRVGLAGQAYTKVPDFAWAVGGTGLKVNCSLIAKGVDENGRIILDEVEGMSRKDAEALRSAYSKNVGTILVTFNAEQLQAALNDPFIDFIIPFHRSQWKKKYYEILGLPEGVKDYTRYQNEKLLQSGKKGNLMPNEYWDFSKSGKENAERYLELCAEKGKRPKFYNLLVDNGDGSYSLQPDGSTDGYWKLLIDFKMYDNNGKGSPQMPVKPTFNMEQAERMLNEYTGGHQSFPVAQDVVNDFLKGKNGTRESRRAAGESREASLMRENDQLRKQIEYWKNETKRSNPVGKADPKAVRSAAKQLIDAYGSTLKVDDIADDLQKLYDLMGAGSNEEGELSYEAAREITNGIAERIAETALDDTESAYRTYEDLRKFLRSMQMTVSYVDMKDITDWGDWRKRNMGRLDIRRGETSNIDRIYSDLSDRWPEFFPGDVMSAEDQLQRMADVADMIYSDRGHNPFDPYMEQAVIDIGNDIMDRFFDLPQAKTFADKQAKKLQDMRIRLSELRARNEERVRETAARERERGENRMQAMKDHYAEIAQRRREQRLNTKERNRLLQIARRLSNKKMPAVNRALLNEYIGDLDLVAKSMTGATLEKLTDLRDWYFDQRDNNPDFISDPHIEKLIERLSKRHIKDMTNEEVRELTDVLLNIENEIRTQNKLIDSKDRHDTYMAGVRAIEDIEKSRGLRENAAGTMDKLFVNNTLSPVREMHRLTGYVEDDPLYVLTNELADGQRKMFDYQRRASERFLKWTQDKKLVERIRGKKADEIKITGIGKNGPTEVTITPAMRMSLYLHSLNDQNLRHIAGGGITVPDAELYKQGKIAEAYDRGTTIKLTPSQVRSITAQMTMEERNFAESARAYFNGMSREAINETSEKLKGYSLAAVDNYFPIDTDKSFIKKDFDSLKFDGTLEGMGFLKERINSASPIMLYDMDNVLRRSIEQHAKYYGLAIPVRNFSKVWGVTKSSFDENGNRNGFESSVQQAMKQKWGSAGYDYIEKLMTDLQSGHTEQNDFDKLMRKIRSNYAGAVLTLNASVAMKQAASYPTAAAVVGWKPLVQAMANVGKVDMDTVNKYTPLLWYRRQGFSTQELGDMAKQDRQLPKFLNWVQGMDVLTTSKLWKAAEYYVRDNQADMKAGSEEYYKAVADVYNRIIEETQPNYTTMQRPQLLRSNSSLLQSLSMFKTQPFQNFNVLYDALGNLTAKRQAARMDDSAEAQMAYQNAKKAAGWAITSQVVQLAVFAGMTAAWNLLRGKTDKYDDDDDEVTAASVLKRIGHDMLGGAASMVPFGSDVWEYVSSKITGDRYYGFDEVTSSSINDLLNAFSKAEKSLAETWEGVTSGEEIHWNEQRLAWDSVAKAVSKVAGVPFENVENLFNLTFKKAAVAAEGQYKGTYAYLMLTTKQTDGAYYDNLYGAYQNDKSAYEEIYASMLQNGFDADKIANAMESRMKKEQGVDKVSELDQRYMNPTQQAQYDDTLRQMESSSVWSTATDEQKGKALNMLYGLTVESGTTKADREKIDAGADVGIDETEYLLYKVALMIADANNEDPEKRNGNPDQAESEAAVEMLNGLTQDEKSYLWASPNKTWATSDKNPYDEKAVSTETQPKQTEPKQETPKQETPKPETPKQADVSNSSMFSRASYDPKTGTATLTFRSSGKTYTYDVSESEWEAFSKSSSKGSYFNSHWR